MTAKAGIRFFIVSKPDGSKAISGPYRQASGESGEDVLRRILMAGDCACLTAFYLMDQKQLASLGLDEGKCLKTRRDGACKCAALPLV